MLGLNSRCGQSKFRKFFTNTPIDLIKDLKWWIIYPWKQHYVNIMVDGKDIATIHNLTKSKAKKLEKILNKAESYVGYEAQKGKFSV